MTRLLLLSLLAGLTLVACGGTTPVGDATLELGTGEIVFEDITSDTQELPLIMGSQGGYHVWMSFRAEGIVGNRVLMELDAIPLSETAPPPRRAPVRVHVEEMPGGMHQLVGWPAVLDQPACYVDRPLRIEVSITDRDGRVAVDEKTIIPRFDGELGTCAR